MVFLECGDPNLCVFTYIEEKNLRSICQPRNRSSQVTSARSWWKEAGLTVPSMRHGPGRWLQLLCVVRDSPPVQR